MDLEHVEIEKLRVPQRTIVKSLIKQALQTINHRGQTGDKLGTTGDRAGSIENHQIEHLSPVSPDFFKTGTGYKPRFYWLSPVSPVGPCKTIGTPPHFERLKPTTAPYLLGIALFSPVQNEVIYD